MRNILTVMILCSAVLSANAETPETTVRPLALADPFIMYYDGIYYAYGTGGNSDAGFDVYVSDSLYLWSRMPQKALDRADSYGGKWFWAPEVYRHPDNGRFYLFYSAEEHLCVASADSPAGPFRQEIHQPMFGEKAIDSSLFIDDDGTAYLFFVRFTDGNVIWCAKLSDDWMHIIPETLHKCIVAELPWERKMGKVAEGPSVLKKNGIYYLIYSANHFLSQDYGVGYATSGKPQEGWVKNDAPILRRPSGNLVGTGHGAVFTDRDGKERYVFHAHRNDSTVHPRLLHIADINIMDGKVSIDGNSIFTPGIK